MLQQRTDSNNNTVDDVIRKIHFIIIENFNNIIAKCLLFYFV